MKSQMNNKNDRAGNLINKEVNLLENLQQINKRRQKELIKAVGKFNEDLMKIQLMTKKEKDVFIY